MILVATGLQREARAIAGEGTEVVTSGGRAAALEAALTEAAPRASAILSMGLAGALAPDLAPGDWVVADRILWQGGEARTDAAWAAALGKGLPSAQIGAILGFDAMILAAADKAAAHARSGALAVDMESRAAAKIAARFGLPFAAARVISDAAHEDLPPAVAVGMRPDGGMALGSVLAAVARNPAQIPALIRTGRQAERAFRALADARRLLGPRLGLPDLGQLPLDVA